MILTTHIYRIYPIIDGGWVVLQGEEQEPVSLFASREAALAWAREEAERTNGWVIIDNLEFLAETDIDWEGRAWRREDGKAPID
ncbi:MAG TPA: DUF2188 domain-containing protein [Planctomycetota bacterium]|nr:DUF2188 domain-containing protein [Planctomycetota bacterium]